MVSWKKLHTSEDISAEVENLSRAQLLAFSIGEAVAFETLVILQSNFNPDKIEKLRLKFGRPSNVAEFIYKKFNGNEEAMVAFIEAFNKQVSTDEDSGSL